MAETLAQLEQALRESMADQDANAVSQPLLALADRILVDQNGSAAAALFPLVVTSEIANPHWVHVSEEMKHILMRSYHGAKGNRLTDHLTVEPHHSSYVAVKLLEGGVLSTGEYIMLIEDLSRALKAQQENTVSCLHVLRDRNAKLVEPALVHLSSDAKVPLLPLARFWPQSAAFRILPADYAFMRGAFAFDQLEDALLVAVLNPYDAVLQAEIQWQEDQRCLFYLVAPDEYDAALALLRESVQV